RSVLCTQRARVALVHYFIGDRALLRRPAGVEATIHYRNSPRPRDTSRIEQPFGFFGHDGTGDGAGYHVTDSKAAQAPLHPGAALCPGCRDPDDIARRRHHHGAAPFRGNGYDYLLPPHATQSSP